MRWFVALLVTLPLVLAACGNDEDEAAAPSTPPPTSSVAAGEPAPAPSRELVVGLGDQGADFFADPDFQALGIDAVRRVVPYDTVRSGFDREETDAWLAAARTSGAEPLIAFGHSRRKGRVDRLPSVAEYRRDTDAFRARYPQVELYTPWNEPNNQSQPTDEEPVRAAEYANALASACADCELVVGDFLDEPDAPRYIARYRDALDVEPRAWGVHDYSATNRFAPKRLTDVLDALPAGAPVWLTETGGLYQFGRAFRPDEQRQVKATRYVFRLARRTPRIERVYLYNWAGAPADARFDAGLTNPDGSLRPAYQAVRDELRR